MPKKTPPKNEPPKGAGELKHNPFAALGGAREGLPEAPSTPAPPNAPEAKGAHEPGKLGGKLVVRREKAGRGGKTVTRVSGLPADRLDELATRMKKALGCGAVVEGADLVLLGSLVPRAAAFLRAEGAAKVVEGN